MDLEEVKRAGPSFPADTVRIWGLLQVSWRTPRIRNLRRGFTPFCRKPSFRGAHGDPLGIYHPDGGESLERLGVLIPKLRKARVTCSSSTLCTTPWLAFITRNPGFSSLVHKTRATKDALDNFYTDQSFVDWYKTTQDEGHS